MKSNKLLIISVILTSILFDGCNKEVIVEVPKPYAVPVKCVVPDVNCTFSGSDVEVLEEVMKCIVDLKSANKVCE